MATPHALLTNWNRAMALFHAGFAIAVVSLADMTMRLPTYRLLLEPARNGTALAANATDAAWVTASVVVADRSLYVAWVAFGFSALSALAHAGNAQVWREWYLRGMGTSSSGGCRCPIRWVEYALSAPLQGLAIAYFCGVVDTAALFAVFALVSTTMLFGLLCEQISRPLSPTEWSVPATTRLLPHALGYVPYLAACALILQPFVRSTVDGIEDPATGEVRRPPAFVAWIVGSQLALFSSFGVVQLVTTLRAPDRFWQGELAYQVLSLVAKGVLSMLLLANVLVLNR